MQVCHLYTISPGGPCVPFNPGGPIGPVSPGEPSGPYVNMYAYTHYTRTITWLYIQCTHIQPKLKMS